MAKILSPVWSIARGSIAGTTYLSGPNNAIIARARTSPVNPQSAGQDAVRGAFREALALWDHASQAERDDWDLYAKTVNYPGPMGSYTPTGRQAFIAALSFGILLNNQFTAGITADATPPVGSGWLLQPNLAYGAPSTTGTGFQLTVGNSNAVDCAARIRISGPYPQSRTFFKGPYKWGSDVLVSPAAGSNAPHDFLGLDEDKVYFVTARLIGETDVHQISQDVTLRCIASVTV